MSDPAPASPQVEVSPPKLSPLKLPPKLIERARQLLTAGENEWEVPSPRDAATVVLLRPASDSFEIFLQRRFRSMAFAAGMYVFPGGAVEEADHTAARTIARTRTAVTTGGTTADTMESATLGDIGSTVKCTASETTQTGSAETGSAETGGGGPETLDTLAIRMAAVRETAEETGYQIEEPQSLAYVAHWVTPEVETRRYDTRFYAAVVAGSGPDPQVLTEADAARWLAPSAALAGHVVGELAMLPPTVAVLGIFESYERSGLSAAEAVARAGSATVRPLLPTVRLDATSPDGIAWTIVDARTGEVVANA